MMLSPSDLPQKGQFWVIDHTGISYLVMVSRWCQSDWIWNQLGDTSLGMSGRMFPETFLCRENDCLGVWTASCIVIWTGFQGWIKLKKQLPVSPPPCILFFPSCGVSAACSCHCEIFHIPFQPGLDPFNLWAKIYSFCELFLKTMQNITNTISNYSLSVGPTLAVLQK